MRSQLKGRIGIALGSGAARGWAHVGVLRGLVERGLRPEIVCGTSAGALVGALYAAERLDELERFGRHLDWRQMVGYFDLTLRGGFIKARKLVEFLAAEFRDLDLRDLALPFGAVATDLESGREIWLREGPLVECLRAAIALPGFVAPVRLDGRWLVDGGLVNAVPISLCRALGADSVIAVDLNTTLLGRRFPSAAAAESERAIRSAPPAGEPGDGDAASARARVHDLLMALRERVAGSESGAGRSSPPSIYEVVANAINIMQVRVTRSRMAGDPPELLVTPRLGDFGLLDFDRAEEAIAEGRRALAQALGEAAP